MKSKPSIRTPLNGNGHRKASLLRLRRVERLKLEEAFTLQKDLLQTRDYAEAVIEAVPPLLVLDQKLRVQTANKSFCRHFKISSRQTLNRRVYELGNGQWNIPSLRTLLEEVLPQKKVFQDFEVTHDFQTIGRRTMLLSGRQVDHLQRILLFIEDVTDRRKAQAAIAVSELRYRRLFEAARDGILILDPVTRKITEANPFMTELLTYSHQELVGKELWEIGLLKDEKASQVAFRQLQKKKFIRYEDLPLQTKAGRRHEVEFVSNVYDEGGRKVIQCNIRDITDRKHAEDRLRESEERYRNLFNSIDEGFCIIEMIFDKNKKPVDYLFLEVNPSFEKQSGLLQAQGKRMRQLAPDFEATWYEIFGRVAVTGEAIRFVQESKALDNRWFDVYAFRLGGPKNPRVAVLFSNVTERKKSEEALRGAYDVIRGHADHLNRVVAHRTGELHETIHELESFSYSVSHDMRAPLRAMQSYASYLVQEYGHKLDPQGTDYLQQIMRSAVRLDRLIQDVLSYTRVLHSKLPIERVDLDRLVRDLVGRTLPNGQPIKPEVQITGTLPAVMGNEALLAQCVTNLLSNGAKFVQAGTKPQLKIWAEETNPPEANQPNKEPVSLLPGSAASKLLGGGAASVKIFFQDNGIGIAAEDHQRIFRLFERIHPTSEYEGTGIGLTIVRKAVERMGAQVGFESELGKGSRFWIQLMKG